MFFRHLCWLRLLLMTRCVSCIFWLRELTSSARNPLRGKGILSCAVLEKNLFEIADLLWRCMSASGLFISCTCAWSGTWNDHINQINAVILTSEISFRSCKRRVRGNKWCVKCESVAWHVYRTFASFLVMTFMSELLGSDDRSCANVDEYVGTVCSAFCMLVCACCSDGQPWTAAPMAVSQRVRYLFEILLKRGLLPLLLKWAGILRNPFFCFV